jgi:ABC-type multidrug transport system fused ATPase/permease subunit
MRERRPSNPFRRLIGVACRRPVLVLLALASLAILSLTQLYLTWLIKEWVEGPVLNQGSGLSRGLVLRAIGAALVGMISLFVSRYALAAATQRLLEDLRNDATRALLRAPVPVVGKTTSGEWLSRLFNDLNALSTFLSIVVRRLTTETILLCGATILMFVLSWRLALATLAIVPAAGFAFVWMGRRIRRWGSVAQESVASLTSTINEGLRGFTTVKGFEAELLIQHRVEREAQEHRQRVLRGELWSAALISLVFLITGAAFLGILLYATARLPFTPAQQATFLAFCLYAGQTVEPARRLAEVHGLLQQSLAAAVRVFEVIDLAPERDVTETQRGSIASVRFERVTFGYSPDSPVLNDVSLAIGDGEIVGIVGASGCGKTTLGKLLMRFEVADQGQISLGGVPLRELSLQDVRGSICLVEQDPFVFSGSLLDNLRLGRPTASTREVDQAVRMTRLDSVVAALPRGLDSHVREAGRDLSGGERQRIALARAIVRDPRVLILDEATSAIDSETELAIFTAMFPWLQQRTVLVVSHRLSTVNRLPRVVLMERGRIVADGPPEFLAVDSTSFRELFVDQLGRSAMAALPA